MRPGAASHRIREEKAWQKKYMYIDKEQILPKCGRGPLRIRISHGGLRGAEGVAWLMMSMGYLLLPERVDLGPPLLLRRRELR